MSLDTRTPDDTAEPLTRDDGDTPSPRAGRMRMLLRFVIGLGLLLGVVVLVVRTFRPQLEGVGAWFVSHFGLAGVAAGTFIADGFHFPVPPQFYMLLATAAHADPLAVLAATSAGSVGGGTAGYLVARRLGHIQRVARWLERATGKTKDLIGRRYPYRSAVAASLSPVAFSVLCYLAGLLRVRSGPLIVLLVLRVPKIVLYYYLVRVGWGFS